MNYKSYNRESIKRLCRAKIANAKSKIWVLQAAYEEAVKIGASPIDIIRERNIQKEIIYTNEFKLNNIKNSQPMLGQEIGQSIKTPRR